MKYDILAQFSDRKIHATLTFLGIIFFIPFLGSVHLFDWDEINFAECAREMIVTGDYFRPQINFEPFWEKPPLFIWLQVISMKIFGITEFAARFPNALTGIVTLNIMYYAGNKISNKITGIFAALFFLVSWLPHFYFKSGIIDPVFNMFIFLAFFHFIFMDRKRKYFYHALLSGLFLGLAVLTKGPVAILIFGISGLIYLLIHGKWKIFPYRIIPVFITSLLITVGLWFGNDILKNGWWFTTEFITYQIRLFSTRDAGHGGPFYYHFLVLLFGCFPASAFMFNSFKIRGIAGKEFDQDFSRWMWIMFWTVLILFSFVTTKIVHYSSLCYFPLCYIAGRELGMYAENKNHIRKITILILAICGLTWALVLSLLPYIALNKKIIIPYIKDLFAVANLQADVPWHYSDIIPGILYLIILAIAIVQFCKNVKAGIIILFGAQLVMITWSLYHFTPRIEAYAQRAAINFYKSLENKDVVIEPLEFKSYAHLFYAKKPFKGGDTVDIDYLNQPVKKPVYFVTKIQHAPKYDSLRQLEKIKEENGFNFYRKK